MFNKSSSPQTEVSDRGAEPLFRARPPIQAPGRERASPQEAPASAPSTIAEALRLEGGLSGDGDLLLEGRVKGDVRVARVVIGPSASVEGLVTAQQVEVRGRVLGAIEAQVVRLYGSAHVEGDIRHGHLSIEGGAYFEGRCQPLRKATRPAEAAASAASAAPPAPAAPKPAGVTPFPAPAEPRETHARPPAGLTGA